MARKVPTRAFRFLARTLAIAGLLSVGIETSFGAHGRVVSLRTVLGDPAQTGLREDWRNPAYWGLKKGEYIPSPGCFTGSWGRKKFAYEICATIRYL